VAFSNVVIAQTSLLAAELNGLDVAARQYDAQVALVRGIGGGWSSVELTPLPVPAPTRGAQ
jgi:outer membrane protein TolC